MHRLMASKRWRQSRTLSCSLPTAARFLSSSVEPEKNNDEVQEKNKTTLPFWWAVDPSIAVLATTATETTMNPVWQHLLETVITWGVPTAMTVAVVAGTAMVRSARPRRTKGDAKAQKPKKKKNPATELYDDLYARNETRAVQSPAQEFAQFLREMSQRRGGERKLDKKALIRRNRGIPPLQYITLTHWNQKLDSYQYSFTSATQSKATAAAKYRERNFDRALSTSVLLGEAISPSTRSRLLELEEEFLNEGAKLVQTIQSKQTKLTRSSIEEEMERMGVEPFQMDLPEEEKKEENGGSEETSTPETEETGAAESEESKAGEPDKEQVTDDNKDKKETDIPIKNEKDKAVTEDSKDKKETDIPIENEKDKPESDKPTEMLGISQYETEELLGKKTKPAETTSTTNSPPDKKDPKNTNTWNELQEAQRKLMELELNFIKDLVAALGVQRATAIEVALVGDVKARGSGGLLTQLQQRPLSTLLQVFEDSSSTGSGGDEPENKGPPVASSPRKSLFVTRFPGDTTASQVHKLREEITAIIRNSKEGDEALVVLESGGGTVTGYGLAAGQLQRIRDAGLRLTVVVEQVAASGGYMMCCVGDEIVGSPFCAFGSIGVISEIPNFHSRLKREGVEWQTVTAGDYKRTLTPFKEVTQEDVDKTKEDLEAVLSMFQKFVHKNRPQLDIDAVATGEVWFGTDAMDRGLCDRISTADDVLTDYVDEGWDVYEVEYKKPSRLSRLRALGLSAEEEGIEEGDGILRRGIRWLVQSVASEVKSVLMEERDQMASSRAQELKYMARSEKAEQIRTESSRYY